MRKIQIHIVGEPGNGKTLIANILRQALSDDPEVKVIFHDNIGRIDDKTIEAMPNLEPMEIRIQEHFKLPTYRETELGWGNNFSTFNKG